MSDELTQSAQWLDLTRIAELTQCPYSVLRRYAEKLEVQQAFGAQKQAGTKGVRWPEASLSDWHNLVNSHQQGTVTPTTAAAYLAHRTALVPLSNRGIDSISQLGEDAVSLLSAILETLNRQQVQTDALLTMKAAHAETGIPYAILRSLRVQVGRRYYVRRSDCMRWIASL